MDADTDQPVVLDSTVCSNYASSESVDELVSILDRPATVTAVRDELVRGRERGYDFLEAAIDRLGDDVPLIDTRTGQAAEKPDRLDPGEAAAVSAALSHHGTLASDDLAARRVASERNVPVTGSIGILVVGVECGHVERATANEWLSTWEERRGYYAPVDRIDDVVE